MVAIVYHEYFFVNDFFVLLLVFYIVRGSLFGALLRLSYCKHVIAEISKREHLQIIQLFLAKVLLRN